MLSTQFDYLSQKSCINSVVSPNALHSALSEPTVCLRQNGVQWELYISQLHSDPLTHTHTHKPLNAFSPFRLWISVSANTLPAFKKKIIIGGIYASLLPLG